MILYNMIKIAPSLLSCDFSKLKQEIREVEDGGADLLHLDIMDGHFVPNITFGPVVVKGIRKLTNLPLDAHLMISEPSKYSQEFIKSGVDEITFHIEIETDPVPLINKIKKQGVKASLSINPETSIERIENFLKIVDTILVMTVHPGFGGQKLLPDSYKKLEQLSKIRQSRNLNFEIAVDGGINTQNAGRVINSGADILVAGSAIFKSKNRKKTIHLLRNTEKRRKFAKRPN
jgi:ribulose-phosphate 3-epimerase